MTNQRPVFYLMALLLVLVACCGVSVSVSMISFSGEYYLMGYMEPEVIRKASSSVVVLYRSVFWPDGSGG